MKRGREEEVNRGEKKQVVDTAVPTKPKVSLQIWTDGSHIKGTDTMGFGIYALASSGREGAISVRACRGAIKKVMGVDKIDALPSNPTMELMAAIVALQTVMWNKSRISGVTLYADYNGVCNYANGVWNAQKASPKTPLFALAARMLQSTAQKVRAEMSLEVYWIRGHSGNAGNERADRLAKEGSDTDTFKDALE